MTGTTGGYRRLLEVMDDLLYRSFSLIDNQNLVIHMHMARRLWQRLSLFNDHVNHLMSNLQPLRVQVL